MEIMETGGEPLVPRPPHIDNSYPVVHPKVGEDLIPPPPSHFLPPPADVCAYPTL